MRTSLGVLSVIIGVGASSALCQIGEGAQASVELRFE